MNENIEQIVQDYQPYIAHGMSREEVIQHLHADGLTIMQSIKVVRVLYKMSLGDAKMVVSEQPVWAMVAQAHQPFHEEVVKIMQSLSEKKFE